MTAMEITSFGDTCLRFKGREGVVVADAFVSIVGPTGRGLTADIATFSHPDTQTTLPLDGAEARRRGEGIRVASSLSSAFLLDAPGEYEVHDVLITGVRTYRDDRRGTERGANTCFVYELDGLHAVHLGDAGDLLDEDMLGELGTVDVACVPIGGALPAARAAELVTQLDARLIIPMPVEGNGAAAGALDRFLHEMSVQNLEPVPKLSVTISSLPTETNVVLLEPRGRG